jgi:DNA end-binding protein Ku
MPRASWIGFPRLSLVTCPVYLSPAITEAKRICFNQLDAETGNLVAQQLVGSKTGGTVDGDKIVKGYEFERGRYVTISDDELKNLQIESSKIIGILAQMTNVNQRRLIPWIPSQSARGLRAPIGAMFRAW